VNELTLAKQCYLFELESAPWPVMAATFPGVFAFGAPPELGFPVRGELEDKSWCEFDGTALRVGRIDSASVQPIIDALRRNNLVIRRMQLIRPSLEDLFFEAMTDPMTGQRALPGAKPPPLPRVS
jgi:hypothetical protein